MSQCSTATQSNRRVRRFSVVAAFGAALITVAFFGEYVAGVQRDRGSSTSGGGGISGGGGQIQVPTTFNDFLQLGTQPDPTGKQVVPIVHSIDCFMCHGNYLYDNSYAEPYDGWANSMMAQSARDPIWRAAVAIANQDAAGSGEFCIRCHSPGAWLSGASTSAGGTIDDFQPQDFDGINCHFCHRLVNPVLETNAPVEDGPILAALDAQGLLPGGHHGNAQFVLDPASVRRGPLGDVPINMHAPDPIIYSPFHMESTLCATCHDVSNPVFMRQLDGTYVLAALDEPHPTMNPHDMMPEQRTFSEWLHSEFAKGGVYFPDGRFGGDHPTGIMQSCQDCHMPREFTGACFAWEFDPFFPRNLGQHHFAGANTWVLGAVLDEWGSMETGLTEQSVADAHERTAQMLQAAADMELEVIDGEMRVRIVNWSGHKLPTGYPEGRRLWVNVKFFDKNDKLIAERGAYDFVTATLIGGGADTKVYEVKFAMDETVAAATGLEPGPSFHLVLNNVVYFDNRIPPVGFTNDAFEAVRAAPVGYAYVDGQHWDDTYYEIPSGAAQAVATLYYQTTSREYIEFLRDANYTDDAGQNAYELWVKHGKSVPLDMASMLIDLETPCPPVVGDLNCDGVVGVADLLILLANWGKCADCSPGACLPDLTGNCAVGVGDLLILLSNWG